MTAESFSRAADNRQTGGQQEYLLAEKMKSQFRNRNAEVSGMRASTTEELMRRAEMGRDPRVNCAEQAFRENYRNRRTSGNTASGYGAAGASGASSEGRNRRSQTNRPSRTGRTESFRNQTMAAEQTVTPAAAAEEIRVRHKLIPPMFFVFLLVGTVMVMFLVLSISEVYQANNRISTLEKELELLREEEAELKLQLEAKNDIREIESIAANEFGMVKEDSLQRRYISLSEGERIELLEQPSDQTEREAGTGGVMLSSVFTALGDFFERFQ